MSQKVWVIEDVQEKQVSATNSRQKTSVEYKQANNKQRNPAIAYSRSVIIWGWGQFYNRQRRSGIRLLLCMISFCLFIGVVVMYRDTVVSSFDGMCLHCSNILVVFGSLYLTGLVFWLLNAWHAYFQSMKINSGTPGGIRTTLLPVVCSFLLPGWGQLLNGQTKKGMFFQVFALAGFALFPFIVVVFAVWPTLGASPSRNLIEWIFSISLILSPLIFLMWLLSIYDAVKVGMDSTIKASFSKRMKYAANRVRHSIQIYGWKNAALPFIKRTTLATLLLALCIITYDHVPRKFYVQQLESFGHRMSKQEMTLLPHLIRRLLHSAGSPNS